MYFFFEKKKLKNQVFNQFQVKKKISRIHELTASLMGTTPKIFNNKRNLTLDVIVSGQYREGLLRGFKAAPRGQALRSLSQYFGFSGLFYTAWDAVETLKIELL